MPVSSFPAPSLPLVGQPLTVGVVTVIPLVQCRCEQGGTVVLMAQLLPNGVLGAPGTCPACGRMFVFRGLTAVPGQPIEYAIEILNTPTAKEAS